MLTPSYLLHATEPAEEIAEKLHADILRRIIERILARQKRGDEYILTAVDKWQLETLQEAGYLLSDIQKELAAATKLMINEIAEAMEDAGVRALEYDDAVYRQAGLEPVPLTQSPHLINIMQRDYEATVGEWKNFTRTTATAAQQTFIRACDDAYHLAMTGAVSPSQAVAEAIEKLIDDGLKIEWKDKAGNITRTDTIQTAVTRAVRTGISQAAGHIQTARMDEMGWDLVLVSSHLGARPDHQVWQGKVYSRSGGGEYPDFVSSTGYGSVTGLKGANCRHSFGPYFEGQKNPFDQYDSEENLKAYEAEQRRNELERRMSKKKQELIDLDTAIKNANDDEQRERFQRRYDRKAATLQRQKATYEQHCKDHDFKQRADRVAVYKWDRSQAAKARAAAKRWAEEHPDSVVPKPYKPISKRLIDRANTVQEVENAFRENDWFVHAEINGKEWRSDSAIKLEGCDIDSAKAVYRAYDSFYKKYPKMVGKLSAPTTSILAPHVDANCTMGFGHEAVTLNKRQFQNYAKFRKRITENVESGWIPKGCEDPMSVVMHELGHALDGYLSYSKHVYGVTGKGKTGWLSNKLRPIVMKKAGLKIGDIGKAVSQYATETPQEWFAECFAEYMCSDNPRKVASEFGKLIDEIMEGL